MNRQKYCEEEKHLPEFLKDFHDQKDIFKTLQSWGENQEHGEQMVGNFRDNMIFTIDYFLWAMALHGYKLQKDRTKGIDFLDIDKIHENLK